jgi:hypothetical protein
VLAVESLFQVNKEVIQMAVVRETQIEHIHHDSGNNGNGFLLGIIVLAVVIFLLFYYGIPALRSVGTSAPQVNVPGKIDVNVNK